jgi:hypothetical protein
MEWQPIETAPLDTPILLFGLWGWNEPEGKPHALIGKGYLDVDYLEDVKVTLWESMTNNPYSDVGNPTHWMPLPLPPSIKIEDT